MIEDLKPYPVMEDSGVPSLGEVPEHWEVRRIKTLFREKEERSNTGSGLLLSLTRAKGLLPHSEVSNRLASADDLSKYKVCRPGDLVMNRMQAWSGMFAASTYDGLVSPDYSVFGTTERLEVQYFEHLFKTPVVVDEFAKASKGIGSGFNRLYTPDFGAIRVAVPPVFEQAAIVRFLAHADRQIRRCIRAKQKLIKLLEEQKQAIIHSAVTRGIEPNVRLKRSGVEWLGDVPEHWEVTPLSRVLMQRKEKNDPIKTTNILSLSLKTGVIPYAEKGPGGNKAKEDVSAYMLAYPGDIVVNSMNVVVGSVGLSKYFGAVSPVYYMLRPRNSLDAVEYFSAVFRDVGFQRSLFGLGNGIMYIESKSSGKLNTIRLRIPMTRLKRVLLPLPPPTEQAAIARHLEDLTAGVAATLSRAVREIDLIREFRTRLIADVVTGKLDVREAAARLPDELNEPEAIDEADALVVAETESADDDLQPDVEEADA